MTLNLASTDIETCAYSVPAQTWRLVQMTPNIANSNIETCSYYDFKHCRHRPWGLCIWLLTLPAQTLRLVHMTTNFASTNIETCSYDYKHRQHKHSDLYMWQKKLPAHTSHITHVHMNMYCKLPKQTFILVFMTTNIASKSIQPCTWNYKTCQHKHFRLVHMTKNIAPTDI